MNRDKLYEDLSDEEKAKVDKIVNKMLGEVGGKKKMSRTVSYDTKGNEIYEEDCINDAPTYPQEQLADIKEKEKKRLVFDGIKIEIKDFVVSTTVSDGRNAYVYRVKCKDYRSESLYKVIIESIRLAKNIMEHRFPMYNDLYYTVDFASNDLVSVGKWRACTKEIILRDNGLIFKTKDEAVAVAKKMLNVVQKRKD